MPAQTNPRRAITVDDSGAVTRQPRPVRRITGVSLSARGNAISASEAVRAVQYPESDTPQTRAYYRMAASEADTLSAVRAAGGNNDFLFAGQRGRSGDENEDNFSFDYLNLTRDESAWQNYRAGERLSGDAYQFLSGDHVEALYIDSLDEFRSWIVTQANWYGFTLPTSISDTNFLASWLRGEMQRYGLQSMSGENDESVFEVLSIFLGANKSNEQGGFLHNLFVETAEAANLQELSNMTNYAAASFMLSMTRLETGATWDNRTDTLLNFHSRGQYPGNTYGLNLSYILTDIAAWSSEIQTIWRLLEGNNRVSGASFGVPNLYMGQYYEAIIALYNIDSSNQVLRRHYEIANSEYLTAPLVISPHLINSDPIFSMEAFNFVLNWAGLRQRVENAGNENFPAIRFTGDNANFADPSSVPEAEVSAFALALTRYSDAVVAGVPDFINLLDSDRFSAMIAAVEGIDNAAQTLGVEVVAGHDFTPYTTEEARRLITALTSEEAIERQLNRILCTSSMLQQVYERAEGSAALSAALLEAGC